MKVKDKKIAGKNTGTSMTGKPNDIIEISPRLKSDDDRSPQSEASVDLTKFRQVLNDEFSKLFPERLALAEDELIESIESMIDDIDDPVMAEQLSTLLDKALPPNELMEVLEKKADKAGVDVSIVAEVFCRGIDQWTPLQKQDKVQYAFSRVNSYLANGKAYEDDTDLREDTMTVMKRVPYRDPLTGAVHFRTRRFTSTAGAKQRKSQVNKSFLRRKPARSTRRLNRLKPKSPGIQTLRNSYEPDLNSQFEKMVVKPFQQMSDEEQKEFIKQKNRRAQIQYKIIDNP